MRVPAKILDFATSPLERFRLPLEPGFADVVVPRFLKEMKTDRIDLLLLHCMTDADWPSLFDQQMKILDDFKSSLAIYNEVIEGEALGVLLVFDRILDMARTSVNVWGDCSCATIVARLSGEETKVALNPESAGRS